MLRVSNYDECEQVQCKTRKLTLINEELCEAELCNAKLPSINLINFRMRPEFDDDAY